MTARPAGRRGRVGRFVGRHPTVAAGGCLLLLMAGVALLAPYLATVDPIEMKPGQRLRPPGSVHWFGTDMYGRTRTAGSCTGAGSRSSWG